MQNNAVRSPIVFALGAFIAAWVGAPPAHAAVPLLDGEIRALAIAGDRIAVIRRDQVVVLGPRGEVLGRLDHEPGTPPVAAKKRRPSADEVLDLAGIPDDDLESDAAEEALDDDGASGGGSRRRARAAELAGDTARGASDGARTPRLLAASEHRIWLAGADGLSALAADGEAPALPLRVVTVGPRRLSFSALAVAASGADLAALVGDHLIHSSDAGASWSLLAVLSARPRAVEISSDGHDVYVLDDDGVAVVAHRERTPIFEGRAYDLRLCGEDLLILAEDGVHAWARDRGLESRSSRVPARRLACAPAVPGVVLALGAGLLASFDGGRTWSTRDDLPATEIESVAMTAEHLWLGTESGLFVVPVAPPPDGATPPVGGGVGAKPPPRTRSALPSFLSTRAGPWAGFLPRVSLVAEASATRPGGDRREIWLLITFPLGRARPRGVEALKLAGDLLRRRAAASVELTQLAHAAQKNDKDAEDQEAAALLGTLQASLEVVP